MSSPPTRKVPPHSDLAPTMGARSHQLAEEKYDVGKVNDQQDLYAVVPLTFSCGIDEKLLQKLFIFTKVLLRYIR